MISPRENILKVLRRSGMDSVPVDFVLCESQIEEIERRTGNRDYESYFGLSHRSFEMNVQRNFASGPELFKRESVPDSTIFDEYGIGHSKGSEFAFHMTRMHHPFFGRARMGEARGIAYRSEPQRTVPEGTRMSIWRSRPTGRSISCPWVLIDRPRRARTSQLE